MGFFGVLFCCCTRRRGLYDETFVEYSYAPPVQSVEEPSRAVDEQTKENACDTTEAFKEITPPPQYSRKTTKRGEKSADGPSTNDKCVVEMETEPERHSDLNHGTEDGKRLSANVNTLSKVQTVVSSAPFKADSPKDKKENDGVKPRVIKPLPQRREGLTSSSKHLDADVPLTPYVYAEQKTMPKERQKSVAKERLEPYQGKDLDTIPTPSTLNQPFVFLAGTSTLDETHKKRFLPSPLSPALAPTPKKSTALSTQLPAPTAVYGLTNTTLPPITTATNLPTPPTPQSTPPKKRISTTPTTTRPAPGTYCPVCASPNTTHKTGAHNLNHGRPYRKCSNSSCGAWNGFADTRGLTPGLYCECSTPSLLRLVAKNQTDDRGRRQAFYSCQYKACTAWENFLGEDGAVKWFGEVEIRGLVREGRI